MMTRFPKIYIDVTVLTLATFITGIQRVTREICLRTIKEHRERVFLIHYNAAEDMYYRIDNEGFTAYYTGKKYIKERMVTKERVPHTDIDENSVFFDLDAAWMCRMKRSYLLPVLKKQGAHIVAHIYDIISITHPQYCLERGVYNFMDYIGAHLLYADAFIVNAEATVNEIKNLTEKIGCRMPECTVVPLGADFGEKKQINRSDISEKAAEAASKPYILMVGTIEPRKNHKLLLKAYDTELKEMGYHIIFAGSMGWRMEDFRKQLEDHPDYGKGIYHFEGLDDNDIAYLYQNALFLAFCSYTEGFGLPVIEAIHHGTPVLAADIPVLREVGREYCVWFEQDNAGDLCDKIKTYSQEEKYKEIKDRMAEYHYSGWENTYKEMEKVICLYCG
ncbi:MAG: glycosyltransferase family 4 protein [Lachnospiraceae bacterium]|nr:glycosyltransferase family 4 protein [Lachnospiraceae bacterium]